MAYLVMAYLGMTYIVLAYLGMAYLGMAYLGMAYSVMAYLGMAYLVLAYEPKRRDISTLTALYRLYTGSISASPMACPLRGYGRAGTQSDRLSEAVILSTGKSTPAQKTCRRRSSFGL